MPPHWRLDSIFATERPHHLVASPDGARLAFILSAGGSSDVYTIDAEGGPASRLTTNRELRAFWEDDPPVWSPDGERVAFNSNGKVCLVDSAGGPPRRLVDGTAVAWLDEERLVIVVERSRSTRLAVIEISDPWPKPFGPLKGDVSGVSAIDRTSVIGTFWPKDDLNRADVFVADVDGEWTTISGVPDTRSSGAVAHGGSIAYLREEGDWAAIFLTDREGSSDLMLAKDEADYSHLSWSPEGHTLVGLRTARGATDLVTIDLEGTVETVARGGSWQSPQWTRSGIAAIFESAEAAPRIVSMPDERVLLHGAPLPVRTAPHRPFERVTLESLDGTEIEGFLFRPEDVEEPVPAVVYPHGGPTSAYQDEWDGHAQYFVDKGYAWLAINFRGSTGYGRAFERANHDDWGVGDTEDCVAAGHYLASLEWVDRDRIAIFGASYGSYLALTSLVHPENPFACGVAKYGDCNILSSWAQGDRTGGEDLERMMGHPARNRDGYRRGSPIHVLDRLDRPLLIAHGEKDARVHLKQSEELVAELSRLGKPYEFVTYPTEGHGLLRREPQIDFYQRLERFLDWHLL